LVSWLESRRKTTDTQMRQTRPKTTEAMCTETDRLRQTNTQHITNRSDAGSYIKVRPMFSTLVCEISGKMCISQWYDQSMWQWKSAMMLTPV